MSSANDRPDPDDMFADTRMSFGDHIEELRTRLLRGGIGFLIGLAFAFVIGQQVLKFIAAPVETALMRFYNKRAERIAHELASGDLTLEKLNIPRTVRVQVKHKDFAELLAKLGLKAQPPAANGDELLDLPLEVRPVEWAIAMQEATRLLGKPPLLSVMSITEGFMVWVKVCMAVGFVIGSPWIFYQLWQFVAAGLYPWEKKSVNVYLPFSLGLFLAGAALCQFYVLPGTVEALLWFDEWIGLEPDLRLSEWLGFAILLPVVFGLSFQTPLIMLFLAKMRLMTVETFRAKRRLAWFVMTGIAAIATPGDFMSMILLMVPMWVLYELGIWLAQWSVGSEPESEVSEPDEMVEV